MCQIWLRLCRKKMGVQTETNKGTLQLYIVDIPVESTTFTNYIPVESTTFINYIPVESTNFINYIPVSDGVGMGCMPQNAPEREVGLLHDSSQSGGNSSEEDRKADEHVRRFEATSYLHGKTRLEEGQEPKHPLEGNV